MQFKDLLRKLRLEAGMTQEELAARASVPVGSLRNQEQGYRVPSWASVVKLAHALGVPTDAFADCDEVRIEAPAAKRSRSRARKVK
jgi:transcriptional regulator with XRE-family HTH domain